MRKGRFFLTVKIQPINVEGITEMEISFGKYDITVSENTHLWILTLPTGSTVTNKSQGVSPQDTYYLQRGKW